MKGKLEEFIREHSEELDQRTPNPAVFDQIMQKMAPLEFRVVEPNQKTAVVISFATLKWLAAACFILALGTVLWKNQNTPNGSESITSKVASTPKKASDLADTVKTDVPSIAQAALPTTQRHFDEIDQDLASRKKNVVEALGKTNSTSYREVLLKELDNESSPASRIVALSKADGLQQMSKELVDVLVETMNNDPNTNVRLAALDGLSKFYKENYVKRQLIISLKKQHDPMVQIALIGLLTRMKESTILSQLEVIVKDDRNIPAVKETAYTGILVLNGA